MGLETSLYVYVFMRLTKMRLCSGWPSEVGCSVFREFQWKGWLECFWILYTCSQFLRILGVCRSLETVRGGQRTAGWLQEPHLLPEGPAPGRHSLWYFLSFASVPLLQIQAAVHLPRWVSCELSFFQASPPRRGSCCEGTKANVAGVDEPKEDQVEPSRPQAS